MSYHNHTRNHNRRLSPRPNSDVHPHPDRPVRPRPWLPPSEQTRCCKAQQKTTSQPRLGCSVYTPRDTRRNRLGMAVALRNHEKRQARRRRRGSTPIPSTRTTSARCPSLSTPTKTMNSQTRSLTTSHTVSVFAKGTPTIRRCSQAPSHTRSLPPRPRCPFTHSTNTQDLINRSISTLAIMPSCHPRSIPIPTPSRRANPTRSQQQTRRGETDMAGQVQSTCQKTA